jgi:hypothetical protein
MRKLLPLLAATVTVTAIIMSSGAAYAQQAREMRVLHNPSAEILRIHATVQVEMQSVTDAPSVPPFFWAPSATKRA